MRKRIINILTGFIISFGKSIFFLFIIASIVNKNLINYDNILFFLGINIIGWILGLMYDLDWDSKKIIPIHSIAFYLSYIGLIMMIYSLDFLKNNFGIITLVYIVSYIIMYIATVYYNKKLNANLNNIVDYINKYGEWYGKK